MTKAVYRRKGLFEVYSFNGLDSMSIMVENMRAARQTRHWGSS